MPRTPRPAADPAALRHTLAVIGGRWTVEIVHALLPCPARFTRLQQALTGISPKMLIVRLRDLERAGYLTRTHYPEIPPRVEYALTARGRTLEPIIAAMVAWGRRHAGEARVHDAA